MTRLKCPQKNSIPFVGQEPTETSHTLWLTIPRNDRFRGVRHTFTAKTGKLPSFSFYVLRGAENREEEKFSGKIFRVGTLSEKDPHPPKEKSVFDLIMSGDFFGDMKNRKDNIREKIGGDFIFEILYGFCGEWIDIVEGFFWDFFG